MKRMITNQDEFVAAIDRLFSLSSVYEFNNFRANAEQRKNERKGRVRQLSEKLCHLKAEIEEYKSKVKEALAVDNKKEYGIRLNQLMKARQDLLTAYRAEKNPVAFAEMSKAAQVYACTMSLLQKYLMPAFVKSSPEAFRFNQDGSVTLNVESFVNSHLYQQVQHIRDYVSSYIEHYPERIKGRRYFIGIHKGLADFDELVGAADEYFEKMNKEVLQDKIAQSHKGIETVAIYPEYHVQAVRLLNAEALAYEGAQMHHCVKTYSDKVKNGTTEIYSVRDMGDDTTELKPHATIEYKEGKVCQIKGPYDSLIDYEYIEVTRRLILSLMPADNISALLQDKNIPLSEKRNIAIYNDKTGNLYDILNMSAEDAERIKEITYKIQIKDTRLKYFPLQKLKFRELEISGVITDNVIQYLSQAKGIDVLTLKQETNLDVLNLSAIRLQKLILNFKKAINVNKIILPPSLQTLQIEGDMERLQTIEGGDELKKLCLHGKFMQLSQIPQELTSLNLNGEFNSFAILTESYVKYLQKLKLSGEITYLPESISFPQLTELDITNGNVDRVKRLDLYACSKLKKVDFMQTNFRLLQYIRIPPSVDWFNMLHCGLDNLEDIDISAMPLKQHGKLQVVRKTNINLRTDSLTNQNLNISWPELGGYTTNWSVCPRLKNISFSKHIEAIDLTGMHLEAFEYSTLSQYSELKQLDLQFTHIDTSRIVDLSQCRSLEELSIDTAVLPQICFPPQIKKLNIRDNSGGKKPMLVNLRNLSKLTELRCDTILDSDMLPGSVESINMSIFNTVEAVTVDFSRFKKLEIKTSAQTEWPNLEKILLAENFNSVILFKTCPHLVEIDVSHTSKPVSIKELTFEDEIMPSERVIYMPAAQFELLQKIKIGAQTEIILPEALAEKPLILKIASKTSVEREQELKQKYPHFNIQREQQENQVLNLCRSQSNGR